MKIKQLIFYILIIGGLIAMVILFANAQTLSDISTTCYDEKHSIINHEITCKFKNTKASEVDKNLMLNLSLEGGDKTKGVDIFQLVNITTLVPTTDYSCKEDTYKNSTKFQNCTKTEGLPQLVTTSEWLPISGGQNVEKESYWTGLKSFLSSELQIYKFIWKTPLNSKGTWSINPSQQWNTTFSKWRPINVSEEEGHTRTLYPVNVSIEYDSDMQPDFADIRFASGTSSTAVELNYWLEDYVDSTNANFRVAVNLTANSNTTIYVYYDNLSEVASTSDIKSTFTEGGKKDGSFTPAMGDDFSGSSLDTSIWTNVDVAKADVTGGLLDYSDFFDASYLKHEVIYTSEATSGFIRPMKLRINMKHNTSDRNFGWGFGYGITDTIGVDEIGGGQASLRAWVATTESPGVGFSADQNNFLNYEMIWRENNATLYRSGVNISNIGPTPNKRLNISLGTIRDGGFPGDTVIGQVDYIYAYPYADIEPLIFVSAENSLTAPDVSLDLPTNFTEGPSGKDLGIDRVFFNVTPTSKTGDALVNVTLYHNQSTWHRNTTSTSMVNNTQLGFDLSAHLEEGAYLWSAEVCTAVECVLNQTNYTTIVDLTAPTGNSSAPAEDEQFTSSTIYVEADLNISVTETNNHTCKWNLTWQDNSEGISGTEYNDVYFTCDSGLTTNKTRFNMTQVTGGQKNYKATIWANDSAGNENTTYINFFLNEDPAVATPGGGGGGGGGTTPDINKTWIMTTQEGTGKDSLQALAGKERTKNIIFENLGEESIGIKLFCEDLSGNMCNFVTFEDDDFTLPLSKEIKTAISYTVAPPENSIDGLYSFNLVGVDDVGKKGIITVEVELGGNLFEIIFTKLLFLNKFAIPYFLWYILIIIPLLTLFFNFVFFRSLKEKGGLGISIVIASVLGLLILGLPFI